MEEDIERAKEFIENIKGCGLSDCAHNKELQCNYLRNILIELENLIKRNKELEEKQQSSNTAYNLGKAFENHKWISLIKEKIEELYKEADYRTEDNPKGRVHFQPEPCDYQIQVLEELLGEEK